MFSGECCSIVRECGYFHAQSAAEHGSDSPCQKGDCSVPSIHIVDANIDDSGHEDDEDRTDFVFSGNEGAGSVADDSSDFDYSRVFGFEQSLLVDSVDIFNFHFVKDVVVVPGPGQPDYA